MAGKIALSVDNLSFSYGERETLHQISFEIKEGEIFGFLGPSGAGKSTTQKILIGLLKNYSGDIMVNGKDLSSYDEEYYNLIGVSFELANHYLKLTAHENLKFYSSLYDGDKFDIEYVLGLVGLTDFADVPVREFSKGMKIRLNFARAIIHKPKILFLDEVTSGLDPVNTGKIINIIKSLRDDGVTIFITTHNMFVADQLCDRVAFMVDGSLNIIDAPKKLKLAFGEKTVNIEYINGHGLEMKEFSLQGLGENNEFLDVVRKYDIQTIHSQEATLDKVFQIVTGRALK